jgi:hypothetical protein
MLTIVFGQMVTSPPPNLRYIRFTLLSYHQYATTRHCIQV